MAVKPNYDLFISYAETDEDDRKWVEGHLIYALGLPKDRIITQKNFRLGASVVEEFNRAITTSRYTLLILSPSYLSDKWSTFNEQLVSFANVINQRERLIPLLRKPCDLPLRIDFRVRLDCTNQVNWKGEIDRLRTLLDQPEPEQEFISCPYPGMVPFSEKDASHFFGREHEIESLKRRLRYQNYLFVIGPSGSGKSSFVSAGLIPHLHKRQPGQWLVKSMRPGASPVQAITDVFASLRMQDSLSPERCPGLVEAALAHNPSVRHLLIIIDQFEELFAQTPKPEQRTFIALLQSLRQVKQCTLILLMRADFYPDLMNSSLWRVTSDERLEITPLRGESLRRAITKPAENLGVYLEEALLERLMIDSSDEPGVLPLLQETMVLLWDQMEQHLLTLRHYEEIGKGQTTGLAVALSTKAHATLAELTELQRTIARRIFLRLVQFGEGRADTRRRLPISDLSSGDDDSNLFNETLQHLTDNRLLTLSGEEGSTNKYVDISHEALITGWPTLQEWLIERREAEQTRRRLEAKVAEWVRLGRGQGALLYDVELLEAERWLVSPDAADLGYSLDLLALVRASQERQEQEKLQRQEAEWQRKVALARQLVTRAELVRDQHPAQLERSVLLAIEAIKRFPSVESDHALRQGLSLLRRPLSCLTHEDSVKAVVFSNDGRYIATASDDHTARVWEVASGRQITSLIHSEPVRAVLFSPDGSYLATASDDYSARIWEVKSNRQLVLLTLEDCVKALAFSPDGYYLAAACDDGTTGIWEAVTGNLITQVAHDSMINAVAFSPKDSYLATASWDGTAKIWEVATGREIACLTHESGVLAVTFSPDGAYVATASLDRTSCVWEVGSNRLVARVAHKDSVNAVAFSPDGTYLATASLDRTVGVWEKVNGYLISRMSHEGGVNAVAFSPDGTYLATASDDHTVGLWEVISGYQIARLAHKKSVKAVTFSPDGSHLASASDDYTARVWETSSDHQCGPLLHGGFVHSIAFSSDGTYLATASEDKSVRIWETISGHQLRQLNHRDVVGMVAFSPNGEYVISACHNGTAIIWEIKTGLQLIELVHKQPVYAISVDSGGSYVVTASWDHTAVIWEIPTGRRIARLNHNDIVFAVSSHADKVATASWDHSAAVWEISSERLINTFIHEDRVNAVVFSPDGLYIATASADYSARVWEITSGRLVVRLSHKDTVNTVIFSPDGRYIVTASDDHTARVWEVSDGRQIAQFAHEDTVYAVDISSDGRYVATASNDNTAGIWEVFSGQQLVRLTHKEYVYRVAFSPDGRYLATASKDGTARMWLWKPDNLIAETCMRLTRNLTEEEWQLYLGDEPYESTCPNC